MGGLKQLIREVTLEAIQDEELYSLRGKVIEVDEDSRTCDVEPLSGEAIIYGVKLQTVLNSEEGFVNIPEDDSTVIVTFLNKEEAFISLFSSIKKTILKTPKIEIEAEETVFNGGDNNGVTKVDEVVKKLNDLEDAFKSLKTNFNSHIHTTTATVSASAVVGVISPTTSQESTTLTGTKRADLENEKIKH